jgi:hypothetical protein
MSRNKIQIRKKKNNMSKKAIVKVLPATFSIVEKDGKKVFSLSAKYKEHILGTCRGIGSLIQTFEEKQVQLKQDALSLREAFRAYKLATGGTLADSKNPDSQIEGGQGLPAFVSDCLDSTCPRQYGKVGTPDRENIVKNAIFRGAESLVKRANKEIDSMKNRQVLIAAGLNPDNAGDVKSHNKTEREDKLATFTQAFCRCMVLFHKHGVTETTIQNVVCTVLNKVEKDTGRPTAGGTKLINAAMAAVLKAQGKEPAPPVAESKPDLMATLKEGLDNKDVPAMARAAKAKTAKAKK